MKHASAAALDRLEPLLKQIRTRLGLKEKTRGAFYRGGRAFLHFHEDGPLFFADIRLTEEFERLPATTAADRTALLEQIDAVLKYG